MKESILQKKSFKFAVRIVRLYQYLTDTKKEFILSKQILRSGTSIGANVKEGQFAQSRADMISKYSIALKETNETIYWMELLMATDFIEGQQFESLNNDCVELRKMLSSSILTLKENTSSEE